MDELPLTGRLDDVIEDLVEYVQDVIDSDEVSEFYVGRSSDLEARRSHHGADQIVALYQTDSDEHAVEVEGALIGEFIDHPKCSNEASHGGGGVSDEFSPCVYLTLWR